MGNDCEVIQLQGCMSKNQKVLQLSLIFPAICQLLVFFVLVFTANCWQNNEMMVRGKMAEDKLGCSIYCNESTSEASVQWPVDQ